MKRINLFVVVSFLVGIIMLAPNTPVFAGDLGNSINVPGLSFGMDSYQQWDGSTTFSANLSTLDQITRANVYVSQDRSNPNQGWVYINFGGTVGSSVIQKDWQSSSLSLNYRGINASTNVGVGSSHDITGWTYPVSGGEGMPIWGDWMSTGNGSVTLSGVELLSSDGGYNKYPYDTSGKGGPIISDLLDPTKVTGFNAYAQFQLLFDSPEAAAIFVGMGSTSVPEPATLCLLGAGAIGLLRRRRR